MNQNSSIGEQVVSSTLWLGSWRWTARLIGFATTIVLARLLLPDDFGLVATGAIVVTFFDILIDLGTDSYLIRLDDPDHDDYDTAWTLRLIVISLASAAIFFSAEVSAQYFDDDRLVSLLQILALINLLRGFTNIGLTMYRRDLQYKKIAFIGLGQRMISATVTVVFAFILQNYWAMVYGVFALYAAELLLSYLIHPYRPHFSFKRIKNQWEFCKWIVARNLANFLQGQGDNLVVAKYFGIELIGFYSMAMRFAALPTKQLVAPMISPIYSGLAKKQAEPEGFTRSVLRVTGATSVIVLPAATLFAALSEPLVVLILGEKWLQSVPLVAPLVFAIAAGVVNYPAVAVLTLQGRVKLLAVLNWVSAVSVIGAMLLVAQLGNLEQLAIARAVLAIVFMLLYFGWMKSALNISWLRLLNSVYRSIIASAVMAVVITSLITITNQYWLNLLIAISAGTSVYVFIIFVLMQLDTSADAGEVILFQKIAKLLARKFNYSGK